MNLFINNYVPQFQTKCFLFPSTYLTVKTQISNLEFEINIFLKRIKRQISHYLCARAYSLSKTVQVIALLYRSHLVDIQLLKT